MESLIKSIEKKFRDNPICPQCESEKIIKHGFFKGKQRYKCKCCGKTFNIFTNTILSWSHFKEKWDDFLFQMKSQATLRDAEDKIGVSYGALFYWRHKLMNLLKSEEEELMKGNIEIMSISIPLLDKNYKSLENRYGNSNKDIYFVFIYDRKNRLQPYTLKKTNFQSIDEFIKSLTLEIDKSSKIYIGGRVRPFRMALLYNKFQVASEPFCDSKDEKKEINVRNLLTKYIYWLHPFRGVSSKHLTNYSNYFKWNSLRDDLITKIISSSLLNGFIRNKDSISEVYAT